MENSLSSLSSTLKGLILGLTSILVLTAGSTPAQAAPPVHASFTTAVGGTSPAVLNKPTGTAAGDLLVLTIISHRGSGSTFTAPSGWSNLPQVDNGTNLSMISFYRFADATDVAATSYSITVGGSTPRWSAGLSRITGVNSTTPINAYASLVEPTSATSVVAPSITPTSPDCLVLSYHATNSNTTFTPDATTTEQFDSPNDGPGTNDSSLMLATFTQATATATGAKTATAATGGVRIGMQIAIAPTETVSIAATTATAVEGGADGLYTFTRGSSTGDLTVSFQLDPSSTATAGTDFDLTSSGTLTFNTGTGAGTIVIPNGSLTATVTLDALTETPNPAEAAETARLNVVAGSGYAVGGSPNATVTITANSFLVTTTANSGTGSLRQAVLNANSISGADTITFSDGTGGTVNFTDGIADTITVSGSQLVITSSVTIAGPGADLLILRNTAPAGTSSRVMLVTGSSITVRLIGLTFTGGNCTSSGGGVLFSGGADSVFDVIACSITGNFTTGFGAGILHSGGGKLTVVNSTISNNTATGSNGGGGIDSSGFSSEVNLINSTVSGNSITGSSTGNGGGFYAGGTINRIRNCTITNNTGVDGISGVRKTVTGGSVIVSNSIIAGNVNNTTFPDVGGAFTSDGGNLIGNAGTATGFTNGLNSDQVGNGASPVNPQLAALANNGGPTQTHALLAGGPALNAGLVAQIPADTFDLDGDANVAEAIPVDQRGYGPRVVGSSVDIGAYERNALPPSIPEIAVYNGATTADPELTDDQATVVDFGSTPQGTPVTRSFTIANPGTGVLSISSITAPSGFTVLNAPGTIDPGLSATFQVRFDAPSVTTVTGSVTIASNDANEAGFDFPVSATATAPLAQPLPLDGFPGAGGPGSVLLTGQQAPGLPAGVNFNYFGDLSLNEEGDAVLYGRVSGPGITAANDAGLWILDGSGLNLMLRESDPAGVAGQTIAEPIRFGRITDTGITHVMTNVAGTGVTSTTNTVGWVDNGTAFTAFYRRGTTFSNLFNGVSQHTAGDDGYVAAQLRLVTGSVTGANDTGIWKVAPDGTTSEAAREGQFVGGTPTPNSIKIGNLMSRVAVSSTGWGVYPAHLTGVPATVVPAAQNRAVLKQNFASAGSPVIVAQSNRTTVPGVAGARFNVFLSESVNASGSVAFGANLVTSVAGVTTTNDYGLWREGTGGLELVLREGQQVPGRAAGVVFNLVNYYRLLDNGDVVVLATLRGTGVTDANNTGLWRIDTNGVFTLILGSGQPIAALGGSTMGGFYLRCDVSPSGRYAAAVTLVNGTGDTTLTNNFALLSGDVATPGVFDLNLRRGSQYLVGGSAKTLRNAVVAFFSGSNHMNTGGGTGGLSRAISDDGRVTVWLHFSDNTNGPFITPAPVLP